MPTCEQITEAVNKYEAENPTEDWTLKQALDSVSNLPQSFGRLLAEVCLIADWGTISLTYFPFDDRAAMAREIETQASVLQEIRTCHLESWGDSGETKLLIDLVDRLSRTQLLSPPGQKKRQLSFLSKYLHWCVNGALPIWDSKSRLALNVDNDDRSWSSYQDWLICVREEAAKHEACCLKHVRPREHPLRRLDKALYMIGRHETALPRRTASNRSWTYRLEVNGSIVSMPELPQGEVEEQGRCLYAVLPKGTRIAYRCAQLDRNGRLYRSWRISKPRDLSARATRGQELALQYRLLPI